MAVRSHGKDAASRFDWAQSGKDVAMPSAFFSNPALARRALLKAAGIGVGSGLMQGAQSWAVAEEADPSKAGAPIWSNEY